MKASFSRSLGIKIVRLSFWRFLSGVDSTGTKPAPANATHKYMRWLYYWRVIGSRKLTMTICEGQWQAK